MKQIHLIRVRLRVIRRAAWRQLKAWILGPELDVGPDAKCPLCLHPLSGHDFAGCHELPDHCHCPVAVGRPGQVPYLFRPLTSPEDIAAWVAWQHKRRRRVIRALRALTAAARTMIPVVRRTGEAFTSAAESASHLHQAIMRGDLRDQRRGYIKIAREIHERAGRADRSLTPVEQLAYDDAMRASDSLRDQIEALDRQSISDRLMPVRPGSIITGGNQAAGTDAAIRVRQGPTPGSRLGRLWQDIKLAWILWRACRRNDAARVNEAAGTPVVCAGDRVDTRGAIRRAWQILGEIRKARADVARGTCPVRFRMLPGYPVACVQPAGHNGDCMPRGDHLYTPTDIHARPLTGSDCIACQGTGDVTQTVRIDATLARLIDSGNAPGEWTDVQSIEERGGGWWWMRRRCRTCRGWGIVWIRAEIKGAPRLRTIPG